MPSTGPVRSDLQTTNVVGDRIVAQLVDLVLMAVQAVVVGAVLALLFQPRSLESFRAIGLLGSLTLPLYGSLLEGYWNGQTVGKRVAGIKVVDERGHEPSIGQAVVRNLPAVVLFSWLTTVVALASIAISDRRQRVFDLAADTYVVEAGP